MFDFDVVITNGQRKSFHIEARLLCHFLLLPRPLLHAHTQAHTLVRTVHTGTEFFSGHVTHLATRLEHALYNYRTDYVNVFLFLLNSHTSTGFFIFFVLFFVI